MPPCGQVLDFAGVFDQGDDLLGWHTFKQGLEQDGPVDELGLACTSLCG